VQQATKVEPAINMKTAKSLGLTFPLPVLGRADEGDLNNGASRHSVVPHNDRADNLFLPTGRLVERGCWLSGKQSLGCRERSLVRL
jgi:hypothetical protein